MTLIFRVISHRHIGHSDVIISVQIAQQQRCPQGKNITSH